MHEASIVQALLEQAAAAARQHGATSIHRVVVGLGRLAGVEAELLQRAYEVMRAGTPCSAAALEIGSVEARWGCPRCGRAIEPGAVLSCPECGRPARLTQGDEIVLERLELEVD